MTVPLYSSSTLESGGLEVQGRDGGRMDHNNTEKGRETSWPSLATTAATIPLRLARNLRQARAVFVINVLSRLSSRQNTPFPKRDGVGVLVTLPSRTSTSLKKTQEEGTHQDLYRPPGHG